MVAFFCTGCAATSARDVLGLQSQVFDPARIDAAVRQSPVGPDEDRRALTLVETAEFSAHVLQFRTGEDRHIHRVHDLTFIVRRGTGEVSIDDRRMSARPGDVFHIPRGVPHFCRNTGEEPLVAVLIFTPPYDLRDSLPVPRGSTSYEREPAESGQSEPARGLSEP